MTASDIPHPPAQSAGGARHGVRVVLRLEGLALLVLAMAAYVQWGTLGWGWAVVAFWWPDLALLAYAAGPRVGAAGYNLTHSTLGAAALLLLACGPLGGQAPWQSVACSCALLWWAHIGMDRMLGYGLKYAQSFHHTHLGQIGRHPAAGRPDQGPSPS